MSGDDVRPANKSGPPHIVTLFTLLGRLKLFFAFVEQSLRTEYLHDARTVEDWLYTLDWLDDSLFPIDEYFRNRQGGDDPELRGKEGRVELFKKLLTEARADLVDPGHSPVSKLYRLLDAVARLHGGLALWQKELARDFPECEAGARSLGLRSPFPSLAPSALRMLNRLMEDFSIYMTTKNEYSTCMTSRKIFLLLYYTVAVRPEEWFPRLHEQVVRQHEAAVRELPPGSAGESIASRRDKLKHYDAEEFMRVAARVA